MTAQALAATLLGLTERQASNIRLVTSLCDSVRDQIIAKIKEMPEDWNGHEMRELLYDIFNRERTSAMRGPGNARKRRYTHARYQLGL